MREARRRALCCARMTQGPEGAEAPLSIIDLAVSCVRFVERAIGLPLDFTPETLPVLDHYLRTARSAPHEEVAGLIVPAAGAYFGEVVRRQLGPARWHWDADDTSACRLEFERGFLTFNPLGSALEAIRGVAVEGSGAHFGLLREEEPLVHAALERMGEVREDDYYRLAVRYETVEQIVMVLLEYGAQSGQPFRVFGPDVYAALRAGSGPGVLH
jgi:hypothetical protein